MKKIFFPIFITALAALSVISCVRFKEQDLPGRNADTSFPEDATLTMGFCVPTGVTTKGLTDMAADPYIESLHVFFFDEDGTLLQVREATLSTVSTVTQNYNPSSPNDASMLAYWTVDKVNMTVEKRIIHLVANLPANKVPRSGSENSIFRNLSVAYPTASYWQRLELNSIEPYSYDGSDSYDFLDADGVIETASVLARDYDSTHQCYVDSNGATVNKGDYIDVNGNKIVNGTGYYFIPPASSPLRTRIPLIRNFVKITINNTWSDFVLRKVALINTPKEGLVAPFRSSTAPKFETAYTWSSSWSVGQIPSRTDLDNNNYTPLLAAAGLDSDPSPSGLETAIAVSGGQSATLFMYERGLPFDNNAVSVLIGGELTGAIHHDSDGLTWFKLEITDADGEYYPFYRGFNYTLEMTGIVDAINNGHNSATSALSHVPLGNISNAKETASLTQINDGNGLTLWVSYIDYTTTGGGGTVPLLYTFYHDNGSTKTYYCSGANDRVTFTAKTNEATGSNLSWATSDVITKEGEITSSSPYWSKRPDTGLTWYLATVTLNASATEILQNDIVVDGKTRSTDAVGARELSRHITYTVTYPQKLGLEITPIGANEAGRPTHLTVTLPNTLTRSAFPLKLRIEAEDTNLTPIDNVTAKVGLSTFDPVAPATTQTKHSYYFVKTIEHDEYEASDTKAFMFDFETTKATSQTPPLVTRVKVTEDKDPEEEHLFLSDDANAVCELRVNGGQAVTGIHLNHDIVWLTMTDPDNTVLLKAFVEPWEASNVGYTWTVTPDPAVATLDTGNGKVTAVGYGTTTITAKADGGEFTASCTVHVYNPVTNITLNHTSLSIPRGSTETLTATLTPDPSTPGVIDGVTWSSSDESVATVASDGTVTAIASGLTIITASAVDGSGLSATCEVDVTIPVSGVSLNKTSTTIRQHSSEVLRATVSPSDASDKVVTWSSDHPEIATVSNNGTVTAVASSGTAIITATTEDGGYTATCAVEVLPNPVTSLTLNKTSTTIPRWGQETLVATVTPSNASDTSVDWSSDHPEIASVDPDGTVHGVTAGTATIKALAHDGSGCFENCVVTVTYIAVTGVSLNHSSILVPYNGTETLSATVSPGTATKKTVTWTSGNTSIATVDPDGTVHGVAVGTTTITVTTDDGGYTDQCDVQVYKPLTAVTLNQSSLSLDRWQTSTLSVSSITPSDATGVSSTYVWSSDDPSVATVDANGVVTGTYATSGSASTTIRAKGTDIAGNEVYGTCTVTVTYRPVTGVTLDHTSEILLVGGGTDGTLNLSATIAPTNATKKNITWSIASGSSSLVTITSTGATTATITSNSSNLTGKVVIRATSDDPDDGTKYADCTIYVCKTETVSTKSGDGFSASTNQEKTVGDVTVHYDSLYGVNANYVRPNNGSTNYITISVSSGKNMRQVKINFYTNATGCDYVPTPEGTHGFSGTVWTWTGDSNSISFTSPNNSRRHTSVQVYYY